jgi:translocation protein SEC72
MSINNWPEALADASVSVELKKPQNQKAHWRKGKCLKEMGRLEEARDALEHGIDCGADPELTGLLKEVKEALEKRQK